MEKQKIPEKKYYTIKIDTLLPAELIFKVYAEDEYEAVELVKKMTPTNVKYRLNARKDIKMTIFDFGTSIIRLVKNLVGVVR